MEGNEIDALCLNESWLCGETPNSQIRFDNYKVYRLDRAMRKRGGGLCAYVHYRYKVDALKYEMLNISNCHIEAMTLELCQKYTKPFTVTVIYRPPQGNLDVFLDSLKGTLAGIGVGKEVFIVGDLNIDLFNSRAKAVRGLKALEREFNVKQLIKEATRVTSTTSTLLDHVYTNSDRISDSGVLESFISDHHPVFVVIKKKKVIYEKVSFTFRQMRSFSVEALEESLVTIDWSEYYQIKDPDDCWTYLYGKILGVLDELYPEKNYD